MTEPNQNDAEGTERHTDALVVTMSSLIVSKRKADGALEIDVDETDDTPDGTRKSAPDIDSPAHLPATCLAAVLNFMWYTDVRQCMLAGKMMAVESARHVETLNIVKASELDAPSARRFRNVSEVNVLCLVSRKRYYKISSDAVMRVVPFLSSIPNLDRVFLGGLFSCSRNNGNVVWHPMVYSEHGCVAPREHQAVFKALVKNIVGGFKSRTLSQSLDVSGILGGEEVTQLECAVLDERPDRPCQVCRHVLSSFPLHLLLKTSSPWKSDYFCFLCVSEVDSIRAMLGRDGADAALRSNDGVYMLSSCLQYAIPEMRWQSSKSDVDDAFVKKMTDQGAACASDPDTFYMFWCESTSTSFTDFLDLIKSSSKLQDVIKSIPRSSFLEEVGPHGPGKAIFARQVFELLLEAGLNLDASDYVIVDPEKEPALARGRGRG